MASATHAARGCTERADRHPPRWSFSMVSLRTVHRLHPHGSLAMVHVCGDDLPILRLNRKAAHNRHGNGRGVFCGVLGHELHLHELTRADCSRPIVHLVPGDLGEGRAVRPGIRMPRAGRTLPCTGCQGSLASLDDGAVPVEIRYCFNTANSCGDTRDSGCTHSYRFRGMKPACIWLTLSNRMPLCCGGSPYRTRRS
jgi:hypothetical protein